MTTTAWKKVVETVETGPDTGDILAPLKRVGMQYKKRALRHEDAGHRDRAKYYHEQCENVIRLIEQ
jgi:hypothetical protein